MKKPTISTEAIQPYIEKIERLSKAQRLIICFGTIAIFLGLFIYLAAWPKYEKINKLGNEIEKLDKQLASMKIEAAKLPQYRKKWEDSKAEFALVKKKLPEEKDIPDLLTSISNSGQEAGLEFILFQPEKEVQKDFYAEIPVSIQVRGGYHNLGQFLSKLASLSRVVNVRDLVLNPDKNASILTTSCTAVTYRFVDKPVQAKKATKGKRRKR